MGIAELPFHRTRIAIAILLAAGVGICWATTWARCQPHADGGPYLGIVLFASMLGCVLWAAASVPAVFLGSRWSVVTLAVRFALAAAIAFVALNVLFGANAVCTGDKWGG
jgi:hypothetical protein